MVLQHLVKATFSGVLVFGLLTRTVFAEPIPFRGAKVLTFGDFGTGEAKQKEVADAMKTACTRSGCDFGVLLGDNFYPSGVDNVNDVQFITKFERIYGDKFQMPFYVSLGNHDYMQNPQAQVDYTAKSKWWKMPDRYYSFIKGDIQFIALDTNAFGISQKEFVTETLSQSKAHWIVLFGHHPIYSNGEHGNNVVLQTALLPTLCKYKGRVVYLSGHDHDMQMLTAPCGIPLVLSGAAAKVRSAPRGGSSMVWGTGEYGFTRLEFQRDYVRVLFYNEWAKEIFETSISHK